MGLNLGVMSAAVTLDVSQYRRNLSGLENESDKSFQRIAKAAAGYLTVRSLFGFASGAMAEFSKLEEGNNKLKYTFSEVRSAAEKTAKQIAETYNLAPQTATNAIADIGDMLTGFGFAQSQALDFARQITERGIDVASFKGLDQTETINRMAAALTGETDSLKMMGVVIRQDTDEFRNMVKSIQESTGATETQAKAQAILTQIMKQTKNAEGDYHRPNAPRTYAQELTDLREAVKTFKLEIGAQIQPIAQDAVVRARELLEWYNKLSPASKELLGTTTALTAGLALLAGTGALAKANLAFSSVLHATASGFRADSAATKSAAGATALFSSETRGAATAVGGFNAALGPVGWAIIALSSAYLACTYVQTKMTNAINGQAQAAAEASKAAEELAEAHAKERDAESAGLSRLEELARYERLNNSERKEAEKLIDTLTKKYGDLGVSIDATTGKLNFCADAWEKLNEQQAQEFLNDSIKKEKALAEEFTAQYNRLINEMSSFPQRWGLRYDVVAADLLGSDVYNPNDYSYSYWTKNQQDVMRIQRESRTLENQIAMYDNLRKRMTSEGGHDDEIAQLNVLLEVLKKIRAEQEKRTNFDKTRKELTVEEAEVQSEAQRKAQESVKSLEWEIRFDNVDAEEQARMLSEKIQEIFKRQSGKYTSVDVFKTANRDNMTEKELADLREIVQLENERLKIRRDLDNQFDQARENYSDFLNRAELDRERKRTEQQIQDAIRAGNDTLAKTLVEQQLNKAKSLADNLQGQLKNMLFPASGQAITQAELDRIQELQRQMEEAFSEQERWRDRLEQDQNSSRETAKVVGDWSAKTLAAMLGASSYDQEIAQNSKRSVDLQRQIVKNTKNTGSKTETYQ